MISTLAWVPKGASKTKPVRYEISQREAEEYLKAAQEEEEEGEQEGGVAAAAAASSSKSATQEKAAGKDGLPSELNMDDYDDEPAIGLEDDEAAAAAAGTDEDDDEEGEEAGAEGAEMEDDSEEAQVMAEMEAAEEAEDVQKTAVAKMSFVMDPSTGEMYGDSEDDELGDDDDDVNSDVEDNIVKPNDFVLLATNTEEDEFSTLEMHIYDEQEGSFYVHHDISLPALPLCMAWMDIPPRQLTAGQDGVVMGSYVAVGTFEPAIEIWNLDVLDPLEPSATLGGPAPVQNKTGKKKKKQVRMMPGSHTDAVIGLSWNKVHRQVLASASGDNTVKVWDVTTQQCTSTLRHHTDKAQSVCWNGTEASILASAGYDSMLCLLDARTPEKVQSVQLTADPECLGWNPHRPAELVAGTEDGLLTCRDVRQLDKVLWKVTAHEGGVSAFSFAPSVPGFLATCSDDKTVKLWDVDACCSGSGGSGGSSGGGGKQKKQQQQQQQEGPLEIASRSMAVGKLFSVAFYPDSPFLLACGGSKGTIALWHTDENSAVSTRFSSRAGVEESEELMARMHMSDVGETRGEEEQGDATTPPPPPPPAVAEGASSATKKKKKNKKKKAVKAGV